MDGWMTHRPVAASPRHPVHVLLPGPSCIIENFFCIYLGPSCQAKQFWEQGGTHGGCVTPAPAQSTNSTNQSIKPHEISGSFPCQSTNQPTYQHTNQSSAFHFHGRLDGRDLQVGHHGIHLGVQVPDLLEVLLGPLDLTGVATALHPVMSHHITSRHVHHIIYTGSKQHQNQHASYFVYTYICRMSKNHEYHEFMYIYQEHLVPRIYILL